MKKNFIILALLIFAIFISGCINILPILENDSITPGKGRLKIYLADSSEKYKVNDSETYSAVYITISKIEAHIAGEDGEAEGEWILLREWTEGEEPEFDLITLQDVSELLVDGHFDAGKYTQLRLFLKGNEGDAWLVLYDSDLEPVLEIPSSLQTGLKLIHPFEIWEGMITKLTIDFDAEKSIIKTGNGSYKLKPVIKVVTGSTEEAEEPIEE